MNGSVVRRFLIVLFAAGLSLGASAQRSVGYHGGGIVRGGGWHGGGPRVVYAYPRTYVGLGLGFGYGYGYPWGYPYGFYGPYGYPPYYYGYGAMPSRLALQIDDIKSDYNAQIKDVRHDKTIPRKERKEKIRQLKKDRDAAVIQARHDYFYKNYKRNNGNGPQPYNGNGSQQQQPQDQKDQKPAAGTEEQPEYQNSQSSPGGSTTQE